MGRILSDGAWVVPLPKSSSWCPSKQVLVSIACLPPRPAGPASDMLERCVLLIGSWERSANSAEAEPWRRALIDPEVGTPLGSVRYAAPWPMPAWSLRTPCLEVLETVDGA